MPEKMADFFDKRSSGYDNHMKSNIEDFEGFYTAAAEPIEKSDKMIKVLDLGVGTGLELEYIIPKIPNAQFLLVDLSALMLEKLKEKYPNKERQLVLINESYLEFDFPLSTFDYVISVQSLHHLLFHEKVELYQKIRRSLKPKGVFIEADFIVNDKLEKEFLQHYYNTKKELGKIKAAEYHLDIPFSLDTAMLAFKNAGFSSSDTIYHTEYAAVIVSKR